MRIILRMIMYSIVQPVMFQIRFFHQIILQTDYAPLDDRYIWQLSEELSRKSDEFPIKIIVNVKKARENGVKLWKAYNGVILSYDKIPKSCLYFDM